MTDDRRNDATPAPPPRTVTTARDRKPEGPRRVRHGLKLRTRDDVPTGPLADAWLGAVSQVLDAAEASEGLRYARLGQTVGLDVESGAVTARVQGAPVRPYTTSIAVTPFTSEQWDAIIAAMAKEAVYLVKFLANELPEGLDDLLASMDLSLLPRDASDLRVECSCKRGAGCRHVATIAYLFAERLGNEPLALMRFRGMDAERLLERLRQARVLMARGVASAHVDPLIPESQVEPKPLEECVEEYWRPGRELSALQEGPPDRHVPHALLRRLGPSPLDGRFPLVGLLASVYDTVAQRANEMIEQSERLDPPV